jgi:alkanesulfonate monooxygenase SsuD/methylene tetrahydromethanopterin reductase-like flavin-dependent oxidoreductase (luciferase family)
MAERQPGGPLFGISITPSAQNPQLIFEQARLADTLGLYMVSVQDHPYNADFLDTWTLLSALGSVTQHVRLLPNVINLPLRPPAVLAKSAATLDILTHGRFEMGLGTGALWEGIVAYGGQQRSPGQAVDALVEAMQVMRVLWRPVGLQQQAVSFPASTINSMTRSQVQSRAMPLASGAARLWTAHAARHGPTRRRLDTLLKLYPARQIAAIAGRHRRGGAAGRAQSYWDPPRL